MKKIVSSFILVLVLVFALVVLGLNPSTVEAQVHTADEFIVYLPVVVRTSPPSPLEGRPRTETFVSATGFPKSSVVHFGWNDVSHKGWDVIVQVEMDKPGWVTSTVTSIVYGNLDLRRDMFPEPGTYSIRISFPEQGWKPYIFGLNVPSQFYWEWWPFQREELTPGAIIPVEVWANGSQITPTLSFSWGWTDLPLESWLIATPLTGTFKSGIWQMPVPENTDYHNLVVVGKMMSPGGQTVLLDMQLTLIEDNGKYFYVIQSE